MLVPAQQTPVAAHNWLRSLNIVFAPQQASPLQQEIAHDLLAAFRQLGHTAQDQADHTTDIVLTTAQYGVPINWRKAMLFSARRQLGIRHTPKIYTLIHITPDELEEALAHFARVLPKNPPVPADYDFPGLASTAYQTLYEQGKRGGAIMAFMRVLQAQSKSIHIILAVGKDTLQYAYLFDLVGAYPIISAANREHFYTDLVLRMAAVCSTREITKHQVVDPPTDHAQWANLKTPPIMLQTSKLLGERNFFTEMIRIPDLIHAPIIGDSISRQYSEGCFTTWEPEIDALIATITGSARPVKKEAITENELAVIVGVRPDGEGALVRHVTGKLNDSPSSEAVEMIEMDKALPKIMLEEEWGIASAVPVARSKLHGHRGVAAYDARYVEYAPLDAPYFAYPVSCATEAQAQGIKAAFSRAAALQNPADPRQVVFTVLPGHGIVVAEKWAPGTEPFQTIIEYMDQGKLQIENQIPQKTLAYVPNANGMMALQAD